MGEGVYALLLERLVLKTTKIGRLNYYYLTTFRFHLVWYLQTVLLKNYHYTVLFTTFYRYGGKFDTILPLYCALS